MRTPKPKLTILYPTPRTGEDDFLALAARISPPVDAEVVYFPWPADEDAGRDRSALSLDGVLDTLRRLGSPGHLARVLPDALTGHRPDVVVLAVNSASFLQGAEGVAEQVGLLERVSGARATSATAAFQAAVRRLRLRTVAVASVYPPAVTDHFIDRIEEAGATVVRRHDADERSDHEVGAWPVERVAHLVEQVAGPGADAVLLPETALHTAAHTGRLRQAARGVPVLTATQVSLWHAVTLTGRTPRAADSGPLFADGARPDGR